MVNKCMNRCSTLLVFRQIKITVRGHFTLTKMAKIKKTVKKKVMAMVLRKWNSYTLLVET